MDDNGIRENGRHKPDQYRSVHAQVMSKMSDVNYDSIC